MEQFPMNHKILPGDRTSPPREASPRIAAIPRCISQKDPFDMKFVFINGCNVSVKKEVFYGPDFIPIIDDKVVIAHDFYNSTF